MKVGRGHIFEDMQKLNEMLQLRMQGYGPSTLANRYGVDHSTIIYHCKKSGLQMPGVRGIIIVSSGMELMNRERKPRVVVRGATITVVIDFDGSKINQGKDYAEYVAEAKKKEQDRLFRMNGIT